MLEEKEMDCGSENPDRETDDGDDDDSTTQLCSRLDLSKRDTSKKGPHSIFTAEDDQALILLYQKYPILWDSKNPDFKRTAVRATAFAAIVNEMKRIFPESQDTYTLNSVRIKFTNFRK